MRHLTIRTAALLNGTVRVPPGQRIRTVRAVRERGTAAAPPHCSDANPGCRGGVPAGHTGRAGRCPSPAPSCGTRRRHGLDRRGRARWRRGEGVQAGADRDLDPPVHGPGRRSWRRSARVAAHRRPGPAGGRADRGAGDRTAGGRVHGAARHAARTPSAPQFGQTARDQLTCGCHVHVSIDDDGRGRAHPRPPAARGPRCCWPSAGNSPSWQGAATGYASLPLAGVGPLADRRTHRAVRRRGRLPRGDRRAAGAPGTILDDGMVYFDARLSSRYPTVEVRVADVCLDAEDAALQAALVRGLAETATTGPAAQPRTELLRAATWRAARSGLTGDLVSPLTGTPLPAADVVAQLVDHVRPALVRGRRPGLGRAAAGDRAAPWQRRDPAARLARRGCRRRRGGPPGGGPDPRPARGGRRAGPPGPPSRSRSTTARERISACASSTTSHTFTFIAATTRPARRQNAMSSRLSRSPRTTTSSYPWEPA